MAKRGFLLSGYALIVLSFVSCHKDMDKFCECDQKDMVAYVSVFASGLNNPRGLTFGPDGNLYVAEGGIGGTDSTTGKCTQVIPPVGPYRGSCTGARILKVDMRGMITTVADKLPSSQTSEASGSLVSGVGDVAFIGKKLFGVLAGAGCSHGVKGIPNGIVKVHGDKSWDIFANLSEWQMSHPVAKPEEDDFEPDGTWYGMVSVDGNLYAVEPNHGEIVRINGDGVIRRVIDISASQGHIVPTALAWYKGNFYVGNLGEFPITGKSNIYKITPEGKISIVEKGFSTILGIAFDKSGGMYVLENTTGNAEPTPGTGTIVRIDPSGERRKLVTGLNLPTAIEYGPDGNLYVSNWGFGPTAKGGGEILKIKIDCKRDQKNYWNDLIR
ncbi:MULTISPECIES: ScyD/ScyE family protein [Niastella]|uniref:ScyD/ScyE family protein n=1 Tax=Niastella soli TaxID=2821487 RepID=A0ABS3YZN1_9BACT|nr:ScyD/ScyE family protein [Niastella soli]MBO9202855.1 ScyD/ScyE family protein [Niastella soli]